MKNKAILIITLTLILCTVPLLAAPPGVPSGPTTTDAAFNMQILQDLMQRVRILFASADSMITVLSLLLSAFLYGVIHTLGPGHHKFLLGAWVFSEKRRWGQAVSSSLLLSAGHAISVLVLFLVLLLAGETAARAGITDSRVIISRVSAGLLLLFSLSILVKRINSARARHRNQEHNKQAGYSEHQNNDATPESGCSCSQCTAGTRETALPFGIAALVPCPGASLFMLWGYAAGRPLLSLVSIFVVSAGMSLTLMIIAALGLVSRDLADRLSSGAGTRGAILARSVFETGAALCMVAVSSLMLAAI